jgi:uncharacterized membrane protein
MFLSAIEFLIPKPLPFLRVGLANIPLLLAIDVLNLPSFCVLVLLKILGQALVTGSLFSYVFLFSAAGSFASAGLMWLLKKSLHRWISCIGLSLAGAFASNAAQLILARYYIFGETAWYIAPPFFAAGTVTGFLLGMFANKFANESSWYAQMQDQRNLRQDASARESRTRESGSFRAGFAQPGIRRLGIGIPFFAILLFSSNLLLLAAVVLISIILVRLDKRKIHVVPAIITVLAIIAFNLAVPFGKVIWEGFGITITRGALEEGIKKALLMEGLLFVSRWILAYGLVLPGKFGLLVSDTLSLFTRFGQAAGGIDPRNIVKSIDAIMNELD